MFSITKKIKIKKSIVWFMVSIENLKIVFSIICNKRENNEKIFKEAESVLNLIKNMWLL